MKRIGCILMALVMIICLVSCRNVQVRPEESVAEAPDERIPLRILCDDGVAADLVERAKKDLKEKYDITFIRGTFTDIDDVVLHHDSVIDIVVTETDYQNWQWLSPGLFDDLAWDYYRDLLPFIDQDPAFSEDDYVQGVFEAGMIDGKQLFFPLGIRNIFIAASEEQAAIGAYPGSEEITSLAAIYDYFEEDIANHVYLGDENWIGLIPDGNTYNASGLNLLLQNGDVKINWDSGDVTIQRENAKRTLDFFKTMKLNWQRIDTASKDYVFQTSEEKRIEEELTHHSQGVWFEPPFEGGLVNEVEHSIGSLWFGDFGWTYMARKYQTELNQSMQITMLPQSENSEHYGAEMKVYGCILKECQAPEAAYEVLCYLSDLEGFDYSMLPVKLNQAEAYLASLEEEIITIGDETYPVFDEKTIETMRNWFYHVDNVYLYPPLKIEADIQDATKLFYRGDIDADTCLDQIQDVLEKQCKEILTNMSAD